MEDRKIELKDQISELKKLREIAGMNRTQFSEYMGIPRRTLEEWEGGRRKAPDYVLRLISYRVRAEKLVREKKQSTSAKFATCSKHCAIEEKIDALEGQLIVSCQALPHEPLHSSFIMGRMAAAAAEGGAKGIRANTKEDIAEIQKNVDLPIIGIVKRDYEDSDIYITPTMKEIEELMEVKPEIIAMDATISLRPGGKTIDEFFREVKERYPDQLFMADCSTVEEALHADELGFDFIGTTMVGYTKQSAGDHIEADDFAILREIVSKAKHKVIAEGNIDTPEKLKRVIELGAYCAVVGSIITRPQLITKRFTSILEQ